MSICSFSSGSSVFLNAMVTLPQSQFHALVCSSVHSCSPHYVCMVTCHENVYRQVRTRVKLLFVIAKVSRPRSIHKHRKHTRFLGICLQKFVQKWNCSMAHVACNSAMRNIKIACNSAMCNIKMLPAIRLKRGKGKIPMRASIYTGMYSFILVILQGKVQKPRDPRCMSSAD
jgi:hypothetical protein